MVTSPPLGAAIEEGINDGANDADNLKLPLGETVGEEEKDFDGVGEGGEEVEVG